MIPSIFIVSQFDHKTIWQSGTDIGTPEFFPVLVFNTENQQAELVNLSGMDPEKRPGNLQPPTTKEFNLKLHDYWVSYLYAPQHQESVMQLQLRDSWKMYEVDYRISDGKIVPDKLVRHFSEPLIVSVSLALLLCLLIIITTLVINKLRNT